ncbi:uncharacterized protein DS421_19g669150 [Arachis hypogaea]|uniref:Uncharacterized protein n=1 Tax=Arachis hypogaea TaxID=3818 RepID=A0A6B9VF73_ARAHY|nr:uncharacterized protein DS421_19g669150 [Arachis hypogaea]
MQRVSWRFVAVQAGRDTAKSSAAFGSVLLGAVKGGLVEMPLLIQEFSIVASLGIDPDLAMQLPAKCHLPHPFECLL